jgi:D-alanyl-D-alanine carboxypeptidase/D-alanyl-D-alanine-endopeptidase (penicillin-binding protein 4)
MKPIRSAFSTLFLLALVAFAGTPASAQNAARPRTTPTPPAASPTATPSPTPAPIQTLSDLQAKIRERLQRPELRRGQIGIKIASLNSGKVVFEENAEKYFMPASNMKNFTVSTALEKLSPDYRYVTSVYAAAPVDPSGTVKGNLRIFGRGDVSISTAFYEGDYYKGLDNLADKIAAAGVKRIEGDLIGDDSYFIGNALPDTWEWDDLQSYYGAEVSALPLNDNAVDLTVKPAAAGSACAVNLSPVNPVIRVVNLCTTTAAGTPRTLRIEKKLNQNIIEITGTLPVGNNGFSNSISVTRPAELFVALLKQRLEQKGITVTGQTRAITLPFPVSPPESVEIAKLESPPFALIAGKTMKPSQNMYTETILRTLGEEARKKLDRPTVSAEPPARRPTSAELGIGEVHSFLTSIGIPEDAIIQHDGSGLSRHDLITPSAVVRLYTYMGKESKYSQAWRDALTIAGVDGTLKNRFVGTPAALNVRGKTGTIDQVSALSGYVTTAAGEPLVFSFIVNGVNEGRTRTSTIDDIVVSLANFNGRVD